MRLQAFFLFFIFFTISLTIQGQDRIDGTFAFQTDPAKKYSIYIPSSYDESIPNSMMVGLHPFNVSRWDAESWCDTLIQFAETNNLLLVCPDGGADGKIDDSIDTAFTTTIIDSMHQWYNIDFSQIYLMGFSWGGKTCYSYGLRNIDVFAGIMPIGAAISGASELNGIVENATGKPFYLVHGANDSPQSRFYPAIESLEENDACVESQLLTGVGHTIDFPNRNTILTEAFMWLEEIICTPSQNDNSNIANSIQFFPNPSLLNNPITIKGIQEPTTIRIIDLSGTTIYTTVLSEGGTINPKPIRGVYFIEITGSTRKYIQRILII